MSSTTVKKAAPAKTKKRTTRKKVTKSGATEPREKSTTAKKKAVRKKAVAKKPAPRKKAAAKVSKKTVRSKKTASTQLKEPSLVKSASPATEHVKPEETNSLLWMSAQANNALKAVKAHQAKKGETILARTRKQQAGALIDDDSLIKIAASMPVDNEGLIEFSTEQPRQEQAAPPETGTAAKQAEIQTASNTPDVNADNTVTSETAVPQTDDHADANASGNIASETTAVEQQASTPQHQAAPQPATKRRLPILPALAAGIIAAWLLGYYYWPADNAPVASQDSATVATQDLTETVMPVPAEETAEIEPPLAVVEDVASAPAADHALNPPEGNRAWAPASNDQAWESADEPQSMKVTPDAPEMEPVPADIAPEMTQQTAMPPPQPVAPVQGYGTPVYGSYPQQYRPAYPQYYYR